MKLISNLLTLLIVFTGTSLLAQDELASHEFEAKDVKMVTLEGVFCDIYVEQGDKVYFKGKIEGRGDRGDYEIKSRLDGDRVEIWVDSRSNRGWGSRISYSKLELTVPADTELRIKNTSGDIYMRGVSGRSMKVSSTSGDIELSDMAGPLEVSCTSGDIEIDDIVGELEAGTTSGDIEVSGLQGDSEVGSTSGDIEIVNFQGDLWAHATSGEIDLRRGRGALKLKTTSGNIDGYGLEITGDIELRASSGDISLELTNDLRDLNFDLESSSGDLRVGSRRADDEMYIKNGDGFWVRGETSSGDLDITN